LVFTKASGSGGAAGGVGVVAGVVIGSSLAPDKLADEPPAVAAGNGPS